MNAIQKLRKAMRKNRQQFGMLFGVSRETVTAWETGQAAVLPEAVQEFLLEIARQRIAGKRGAP
jgi:DNA-binding transcriptional regulator YiaG